MADDMADISVQVKDGDSVNVPGSTTVMDALTELLSGKQRKRALAAYANGKAVDLFTELTADTVLETNHGRQ